MMAVIQAKDDLLEMMACLFLGEAAFANQVLKELAALDIFQDEMSVSFFLYFVRIANFFSLPCCLLTDRVSCRHQSHQ